MPDVRGRLLAYGLQPTGTSAAELAAIQKADSERWAPVVKASGFTAG
jgi:tripartite-type tricarboxylate transporter receptor subunit TctC